MFASAYDTHTPIPEWCIGRNVMKQIRTRIQSRGAITNASCEHRENSHGTAGSDSVFQASV